MSPIYLGLALLSAAALAFETTLTRLFSVTQWYHFAFLAISVALLGYGASGMILSLVPRWACPPAARRASILSLCFALSMVGAYLGLNYLPFDSYRIAWEPIQTLYLVLTYLALAVPFFCAGLVTGLLLTAYAQKAASLYAANLVGSALGGVIPVLVLPLVGEGAVLVIAAVGLLAVLAFQLPISDLGDAPLRLPLRLLVLLICFLLFFLAWDLPSVLELRLSPYKGLSQVLRFPDAQVIWQRWNSFSRVDRVASSAIRSAPGLSLSYPGELPAEDGLFVDGDDLSPVLLDTTEVQTFTDFLPAALAYQLRPKARVLVLEARGGLDLWTALSHGTESVVAVESNPLLVEAAGTVYQDPRVRVITEEGRSYVRRSREQFDVIHLSLSDSYRPVTSGAYSLGERYDLTIEAFQDYLARLQAGGLLIVERWLQLPPSEEVRAGATAVEALRRAGVDEPATHLAVLRDWQLGLILVKNGPFSADELTAIRQFAQARGLDLVALPGLTEPETNQYNVLPESVYYPAFQQLFDHPRLLYATHPYNVRPATDDRPFFFHFFRWGQTRAILQQLGKTWQPWGGSGYFVLLALLAVALVTSVILIVLPLVVRHRFSKEKELRGRVLIFFGLLGLGFLFVEIPMIQRFILFLGQPVYAFTAIVAAILFFSGLGSLSVSRLSFRRTMPWLVIILLLYPFGLPVLFQALLGTPLPIRLLATGLSLAPLGFLMGLPFPGGLSWLRERAPGLIPWAWAINGCASVLSSILAAIIALSAGFSWVLVAAALAYAGAWLVLR
ncbi:MAG: hypothetical protein ACUVWZ_11760 [Anaerolineae bacterium]